ncbi:MAG: glycosyltransferase [Calditrichaeota bacterium]|nr:MAG: glycosyltransferase [Calditrichota bacterium]
MSKSDLIRSVAFVGDYVPRRCGIATFTHDLCQHYQQRYPDTECLVVSVNDREQGYAYPREVRFEISEQNINDYRRAADFLNIRNCDVVSLQHEYGIFGGKEGAHIVALLRDLHMPVVTTLHTILEEPNPEQRRVLMEIISFSTRLVVMTEKGKELLKKVYKVPEDFIDVIPHGIPEVPFIDPNFYKDKFGVEGNYVLLTFGLLSPNKGIEYVIKALPSVIQKIPNLVYIILGATHPNLVKKEGEAYRLQLQQMARDLGVEKHVVFYNAFVSPEELNEFIGAADIYITPYLNKAQITSGTLSYAFGCGKAVISTPYWHAEELLKDGRGMLVPFRDSEAIADAIIDLLQDEKKLHAIRKQAFLEGRRMLWKNVVRDYHESFMKARLEHQPGIYKAFSQRLIDGPHSELPEIRLDHLKRLTDSIGIFQHAKYSIPQYAEGYCTDDNSRALLLTLFLEELGIVGKEVQEMSMRYAAFLNYAFNPETGCFRNFMSFDRKWIEECGSEDSHGRALWALGACVGRSSRRNLQMWAASLMETALPKVLEFSSPRSWAFTLLGLYEYSSRLSHDRYVNQMIHTLSKRLYELYERNARPDWQWFENVVTYDNAKLPHALILSAQLIGDNRLLQAGLTSLRWLAEIQTAEAGHFRPIGSNGFYPRGGSRALFDQQPLEAHSMTSAALDAYRITGDRFWYDEARKAFEWFLGKNDLGLALYDPLSGGCHDALQIDRLNLNQGAESTLAFLLSLAEMKLFEEAVLHKQKMEQNSRSRSQQVTVD